MICSIDGCTNPARRRGWCSKHYGRWWRWGNPSIVKPISLPKGMAARNHIIDAYKRNAAKYGREFNLLNEELDILFNQNCYYCGSPPSNVYNHGRRTGNFIYNGIDRIDNDLGYIPENVVSACGKCNLMKMQLSQKEFFSHINKIWEYNRGEYK